MKVIITKYAVTSGVKIMEAVLHDESPGMIKTDEMFGYYHGNDWHQTKENARNNVRKRFKNKRLSLLKQLIALAGKETKAIDTIEKAELWYERHILAH